MTSNDPQWHPEAILDAERAREWYANGSAAAARGFLLALDAAVRKVTTAPRRWPPRDDGCRCYVFQSPYPFVLVYRLVPEIEILAAHHQRRHPDYWKDR